MNETENQNKSNCKNILWWIFLIQFICLICLFLIFAIVSSINGVAYNFFGDQTPHYGFEAFWFVVVCGTLGYWYIFAPSAVIGIIGAAMLIVSKEQYKKKVENDERDI